MSRLHLSREDAAALAKKALPRGLMGPPSEIEISLPDIAGSIYDIRRFACVDLRLRLDYETARSYAFAYGEPYRQRAEDLLDAVIEAKINADLAAHES